MVRKSSGLIAEIEMHVRAHFSGTRLDHPLHGVSIAESWSVEIDGARDDGVAAVRAYESLFAPEDLIYVVDHDEVAGARRARYFTGSYDEQSRRLKYRSESGVELFTIQQTFYRTLAGSFAHEALLTDSASGRLLDPPHVFHSTSAIVARSLRSFLSLYAPQSGALDPVRAALSDQIFQDRRLCG
jgi:hypothetical protein